MYDIAALNKIIYIYVHIACSTYVWRQIYSKLWIGKMVAIPEPFYTLAEFYNKNALKVSPV